MERIHWQHEIPVTKQVDVLVAGGGTAGTFAAVCAAKEGARTMLAEKNGMLGGTMTTANVNFPGLFYAWGKQIIAGPCWEAILRAEKWGGADIPAFVKNPPAHWKEQILLNRFVYAAVLDEICQESGVDLYFHTMLSGVEESEEGVLVLCTGKEGLYAVKTKVLIDATGDAGAVAMAGYRRVRSDVLQPATLMHHIAGYTLSEIDEETLNQFYNEALWEGTLHPRDFQGNGPMHSLKEEKIYLHTPGRDASVSKEKTRMELEARHALNRVIRCLRRVPGLEGLYVDFTAEECGVRETWRIVGEKEMTVSDYLAGTVYEDAVCHAFYPIDIHVETGVEKESLREGIVPTIPYGALVPKGSKWILAAGRCAAGDTAANSAYRVQAPCMAMGQAAGVAAALSAQNHCPVSEVDYGQLCASLRQLGAIVPAQT